MTGRRDLVQTKFVEPERDEASGHFRGVTKTPRVLREDVSEFTLSMLSVRELKVGSADQITIGSNHSKNE